MNPSNQIEQLRVLCFGMGAIGTYIGGSLANVGAEVTFVEKPEFVQSIQSRGITLEMNGIITSVNNIRVISDIKPILQNEPFDISLIAVKSFDTESVLNDLKGLEKYCPPILCLQNGVENESVLAEKLGERNVISGTITSAVGRTGPGSIRLEKMRGVGIETGHPISERLITWFIKAGLNAIGYPKRGDMKWSKMLTNLLANATSAILNWTPQQVFSNAFSYKIEIAQIKEAIEVMNALGYHVINLPGTPVAPLMFVLNSLPAELSKKLVGIPLAKARGAKMPSFHIDLYSGKEKSEVVYLNGAVARIGKEHSVSTPVNSCLSNTLEDIASGKIKKEEFSGNPRKLFEHIGIGY